MNIQLLEFRIRFRDNISTHYIFIHIYYMSNNSNFNYLDIIPESPPIISYQPVQQQQFQQLQMTQQQMMQVMGPNGKMINISELEQAIRRFQQVNPIYTFEIIRVHLQLTLDKHYNKYFTYLETIKQRRGHDEYLSNLRKLFNKMNEYISKTEQTIIKLKKTLDYTDTTFPIQPQFQPINGTPHPIQNTFMIHELQNVIEKDNHIEFVDIFGLKGKNIAHISSEDRITILIVIQSLMNFNPSLDMRENQKLNNCLNLAKKFK